MHGSEERKSSLKIFIRKGSFGSDGGTGVCVARRGIEGALFRNLLSHADCRQSQHEGSKGARSTMVTQSHAALFV